MIDFHPSNNNWVNFLSPIKKNSPPAPVCKMDPLEGFVSLLD